MNYLAHAYLSFRQEEVLLGNFIGDFVKGKMMAQYPDKIRHGILLHREIDKFTDSHPLVRAGQTYLRPKFGHYSTVITDIFFDYFLGKNWNRYSNQSLEDFTLEVYEQVSKYEAYFPNRFGNLFYWMKKDNWLLHYSTIKGIQSSLTGLSKRTKFDSKMEQAHLALLEKEEEFEIIFFAFFEDLKTFAKQKLEEIQHQDDIN
ncbi:acyl carrier protein phosphodiesterase [Algoriphagus machipongonensis]|uniref:Acyl carrier protein phosphodiesterase n=1 Tax=Algoriphagus machipongonensis TaxID=388413 RepID=A3HZR8_9BACT|nr:ACP phosphodiesterase [Algoriphagus machipongonensis]EAZ80754.1 acyl carrier protein phosphodiesterase [Algoriphagus machipongonensis]